MRSSPTCGAGRATDPSERMRPLPITITRRHERLDIVEVMGGKMIATPSWRLSSWRTLHGQLGNGVEADRLAHRERGSKAGGEARPRGRQRMRWPRLRPGARVVQEGADVQAFDELMHAMARRRPGPGYVAQQVEAFDHGKIPPELGISGRRPRRCARNNVRDAFPSKEVRPSTTQAPGMSGTRMPEEDLYGRGFARAVRPDVAELIRPIDRKRNILKHITWRLAHRG